MTDQQPKPFSSFDEAPLDAKPADGTSHKGVDCPIPLIGMIVWLASLVGLVTLAAIDWRASWK